MVKKPEKKSLYQIKRQFQREKRDLRKKILGIDEDHTDTSMQRIYTVATKTRRALKVEMLGSKSKSSGTGGKETSIEIFVKKILEDSKVKFVEQKAISYVNVDFFIQEQKLVIQVNGSYWHCDKRLYPNGPVNKTHRKNIEKDKQANEIIEKAKYKLLVIWEYDVEKFPGTVKKNILRILGGEGKEFEDSSSWNQGDSKCL